MTQPTIRLAHLKSLQSLRGIAAVLVLIFHLAGFQRGRIAADAQAELDLVSGVWDRGYMGVDLFFVISGFVMVYVTRRVGEQTGHSVLEVLRFMWARVTRIYPIWWVFAGLMVLYIWLVHHSAVIPGQVAEGTNVPLYILKSFFLIPQHDIPVLSLGWTLIHEVYFYIVFAGLLFLPKRILPAALLVWAVCVGVAFALGVVRPMANSLPTLMASLLSLEFIGGALAAWVITRGTPKYAGLSAVIGTVLLLAGFCFYDQSDPMFVFWGRVVVFGAPCVLLVYGLAGLEILGRIQMPRWSVSIGNWSYSLYLSHLLVLGALMDVFTKGRGVLPESMANALTIGAPGMLDNIVHAGFGFMACIVFAAVSYTLIERPLIRLFRRKP